MFIYFGEEDLFEVCCWFFYVAIIWVQECLYLFYVIQGMDGKVILWVCFVDELLEQGVVVVIECELFKDMLLEVEVLWLMEQWVFVVFVFDWDIIEVLLEGFQFSVFVFNCYFWCFLGFYYENVFCVLVLMCEVAYYGIVMYYVLECYFECMCIYWEQEFLLVEVLIEGFEQEMECCCGFFVCWEFECRLEVGWYNLQQYFEVYCSSWFKNVQMEYWL